MSHKYYDIVIIGSGMSGLHSAYNIQQTSPDTSFVVLEKYKKQWIGGRTNNEIFYGTEIVTGAGVGRKNKDKLLVKLLKDMNIPFKEFTFKPHYSKMITHLVNINKTIDFLKHKYNNEYDNSSLKKRITFKEFAKPILGDKLYNDFLICSGYTDYENEDAFEVIEKYGMDDNTCCWKGMYIHWKQLVMTLCNKIGAKNIKTSMNVISVSKIRENPCRFLVETEGGIKFESNRVIIATTISGIRKILPGASTKNSIYNQIEGQNFLRLYGKFSKYSSQIMKQYVKGYTIVPGPLQKIIPMDADKGVYMIAYSDNKNATFLKDHLEDNEKNRSFFCDLVEKSLGIQYGTLDLVAIKDFYWPIGTHYYKPLQDKYSSREEFIYKAQHPEDGIIVVGEVVSENQGWTNGALSSVKMALKPKWIKNQC